MARLIDADVLFGKLSSMIDYCRTNLKVNGLAALFEVLDAIMDCKTIDAVEVVRCKDCRWFEPCEEIEGESCTGYCIYGECCTDEMDFCSRGERKGE